MVAATVFSAGCVTASIKQRQDAAVDCGPGCPGQCCYAVVVQDTSTMLMNHGLHSTKVSKQLPISQHAKDHSESNGAAIRPCITPEEALKTADPVMLAAAVLAQP